MRTEPSDRADTWSGHRLVRAAVLTLAMGSGPLTIYALSALSPLLIPELHLTRTQFGLLATLAFVVAAPLSLAAGPAAELLGGYYGLLSLFVVSALSIAVLASARSYTWLMCAVVLCAWCQALSNPLTNHLISVHVPPREQGALIGIKQSGVQISQFLSGLVLPWLGLLVGWRGTILVMITPMLCGVLMTHRSLAPGPRRRAVRRGARRRPKLPTQVWVLTGYITLMAAGMQATNVYVPLFAHQELRFGPAAAGAIVAAVGGAGLVARIMWGAIADRVGRPLDVLAGLAGLSVLASALLLIAQHASLPWLAWGGATLHGVAALPASVVVTLTLIRLTKSQGVGRASGVLAVGMFIGFATGPASFGYIVDQSGDYTPAWLAVAGCYGLAAGLMFLRPVGLRRRASPSP
ncbi:MAG TPA: MFS transporter [Actinopolymorphaceae bacterium]